MSVYLKMITRRGNDMSKKSAVKTFTLRIPRPQYDRLASAFDSMVDEEHFISFDPVEDTVTFKVPENPPVDLSSHLEARSTFFRNCFCSRGR